MLLRVEGRKWAASVLPLSVNSNGGRRRQGQEGGMNWSGVISSFSLVVKPSHYHPQLIVKDISHLNFPLLKQRGVTRVVVDKDNCLTKPHHDTLVPSLATSWGTLIRTFGRENVLIVSNSAGTKGKDSLFLQAESVARHLQVPVLLHAAPKPSRACCASIQAYFSPAPLPTPSFFSLSRLPLGSSLPPRHSPLPVGTSQGKLLVIGDRLTTDMILAKRLGGVGVLTTGLHASEGLGTGTMRFLERVLINIGRKGWEKRRGEVWEDCVGVTDEPVVKLAKRRLPLPRIASPSRTTLQSVPSRILSLIRNLPSLPSQLTAYLRSLPAQFTLFLSSVPTRFVKLSKQLPSHFLTLLDSLPYHHLDRATKPVVDYLREGWTVGRSEKGCISMVQSWKEVWEGVRHQADKVLPGGTGR